MSGIASRVRHPVLGSLLGLLLLAPLPARADVLVAGGAQPQNQPDIAVNPLDPLNVAVACEDRLSTDFDWSGARCTNAGRACVPTTLPLDGFTTGSNPRVTFGPDGKLYVACQHFDRSGGADRINVFASTGAGGA